MNKKLTGFTLMELLIVVTIISILATIILPTYQINTTKAAYSGDADHLKLRSRSVKTLS